MSRSTYHWSTVTWRLDNLAGWYLVGPNGICFALFDLDGPPVRPEKAVTNGIYAPLVVRYYISVRTSIDTPILIVGLNIFADLSWRKIICQRPLIMNRSVFHTFLMRRP